MPKKPGDSNGRYGWRKPGLEATEHPSLMDIAWAAGIYEGEGTCSGADSTRLIGGRRIPRGIQASVAQKDQWLLQRMVRLFGGSIADNNGACSNWQVSGARARGFLLTVYPFLSPRRQIKIRAALGA